MTPESVRTKIPNSSRSKTTYLMIILVGAIFPILLCITSSTLFIISIFSRSPSQDRTSIRQDQNIDQVINEEVSAPPTTPELKDIVIDPDIDQQFATQLIQSSSETFDFTFDDDTDAINYEYERDLLLANIQYQYERLRSRFNRELKDPINLVLTNDQAGYELELGFRYDSQLPYAGVTKPGMIMILIAPDKDYDRADLVRLLAHELVHSYQFDSEGSAILSAPLWFTEGTAEYYSQIQLYDPTLFRSSSMFYSLEDLNDALLSPDIDQALSAYVVAHYFIDELVRTKGEESVVEIMLPDKESSSFYPNFIGYFDATPEEIYRVWYSEKFISEWFSNNMKPKSDQMLYNTLAFK